MDYGDLWGLLLGIMYLPYNTTLPCLTTLPTPPNSTPPYPFPVLLDPTHPNLPNPYPTPPSLCPPTLSAPCPPCPTLPPYPTQPCPSGPTQPEPLALTLCESAYYPTLPLPYPALLSTGQTKGSYFSTLNPALNFKSQTLNALKGPKPQNPKP